MIDTGGAFSGAHIIGVLALIDILALGFHEVLQLAAVACRRGGLEILQTLNAFRAMFVASTFAIRFVPVITAVFDAVTDALSVQATFFRTR